MQVNQELLSCIPHRNSSWKVNKENDLIILLRPKFSNRIFARYLMPRLKNPYYHVNLDTIGTKVWNTIDGKRTIKEIGQILKNDMGDAVDPVYERLSQFIISLQRYKFILLQKP
jgi:hypothetical protein